MKLRHTLSIVVASLLLLSTITEAIPLTPLSFGFKAGANQSTFTGDSDLLELDDAEVGFSGGVYARYQFSDHWSIQPELLYTVKGASGEIPTDFGPIDVSAYIQYIEIPVLVKYQPIPVFGLYFGPSIGFRSGDSVSAELGNTDNPAVATTITDAFEDTEITAIIGASAELPLVTLNLQYAFGLTNLAEGTDDNGNELDIRSSTITLSGSWNLL